MWCSRIPHLLWIALSAPPNVVRSYMSYPNVHQILMARLGSIRRLGSGDATSLHSLWYGLLTSIVTYPGPFWNMCVYIKCERDPKETWMFFLPASEILNPGFGVKINAFIAFFPLEVDTRSFSHVSESVWVTTVHCQRDIEKRIHWWFLIKFLQLREGGWLLLQNYSRLPMALDYLGSTCSPSGLQRALPLLMFCHLNMHFPSGNSTWVLLGRGSPIHCHLVWMELNPSPRAPGVWPVRIFHPLAQWLHQGWACDPGWSNQTQCLGTCWNSWERVSHFHFGGEEV